MSRCDDAWGWPRTAVYMCMRSANEGGKIENDEDAEEDKMKAMKDRGLKSKRRKGERWKEGAGKLDWRCC